MGWKLDSKGSESFVRMSGLADRASEVPIHSLKRVMAFPASLINEFNSTYAEMKPSRSSIPSINEQPPAVDFIDNHLDSYHPAFATPPSRYDPARGIYIVCDPHSSESLTMLSTAHSASTSPMRPLSSVPHDVRIPPRQLAEELMAALEFWDKLFPHAMDRLKIEHPTEPDIKQTLKIRDKTDCTSVFDQLEKAKEHYSSVDKGFKSKFRHVYRKLADNAEPFIGVTKLIPNNEYVTPVLGAVQVLLEAAEKAAKVREEVLNAFNDVGKMFSQVEVFLQIYKNDKNLEKASITLIATIFHAIECAIEFFSKSTVKRGIIATFNPGSYRQKITESLSAIRSQSETLIAEADMSGKYEMSNGMQMVLDGMAISQSKLEELSRKQEESEQVSPPGDSVVVEQYIDPQDLLDWINIPDLALGDMKHIRQVRQVRVPEIEQARAEQLVQTTRMRDWLVSPHSSQLLVHGNYDPRRQISGLTLLCTSLADSIAERAPQSLHLVFFCGLHVDSATDEFTGGHAMIQSFICQLLCQYDFSTSVSFQDVSPELLLLGDIDELCWLLELLIHRLPSSTLLVCLIDGIGYYEREEFVDSMADVLVTILRISKEQQTAATIKVLLTSPTRTIKVRQPFPDELIISMESMARPGVMASKGRLERQLRE
ncbi:hypothetical protein ACHAPJ_011764 [Fusarium lateritium]